jgi:tape measure domain-containing protein
MVRLVGDGSSYQRMIAEAERSTARLSESVQFHSQRIAGLGLVLRGYGSSVAGLVAAGAGVLGVGLGIGAIGGAVKRAAGLEEDRISLGVMLQDMEKGKKLIEDIQKFAAATPLNQPDILHATKTLLQFRAATENDVIPTLQMLGDVTGGNSQRFNQMALAFGQMSSAGHLMGNDLLQMINAGFNPLTEISRKTGESMDSLRQKMEKGQITVKMVYDAFKSATSSGGAFFGLMEKQSQTMKGLFSTLQDDVGMALTRLGEKIVDVFDLKSVIKSLSAAAQESGRWVDFLSDKFVEAGRAVREFLNTTGVQAFRDSVEGLRQFADENRKLVLGLALSAGAVAAVAVAYHVLRTALMTTLAVAVMLKLDQLVGIALWGVYKIALLAATAVQLIYTGTVWLLNAALTVGTFVYGLFTGATTLATIGTWLLNAALTVLNAELLIPLAVGLVAAAVTAGVLVVAFAGLAAAAYGVYKGASAALDVILSIPASEGPIKAVADLFSEWGRNLQRIADVSRKDLPMAFDLLKLQAQLAVSQVRDLWPPLMTFIVTTSKIAWGEFKSAAVIAFGDAVTAIWDVVRSVLVEIKDGFLTAMDPRTGLRFLMDQLSGSSAKVAEAVGKGVESVNMGKHWELQMRDAMKAFKDALKESANTAELRKQLDDLFALTELKLKWRDQWAKMFGQAAGDGKKKFEETPAVMKVVPKFEAAAWNSGEAATRIAEFRDRLGLVGNPRASGPGALADVRNAGLGSKADVVTKGEAAIAEWLRKIFEKQEKYADLGGFSQADEDDEESELDNGDFDLM